MNQVVQGQYFQYFISPNYKDITPVAWLMSLFRARQQFDSELWETLYYLHHVNLRHNTQANDYYSLNVVLEWLALLLRIREVPPEDRL
jgi:hypothetical protein